MGVLKCILPADSLKKLRSLREAAAAAVVRCACGASWCTQCRGPPHWPATCSDQRWLDANRGLLVAVRTEGNKLCPACWVEIEKTGGCNHMKCRMCQNDF